MDEIRTLEKDVEDALTKSGDMDKEKKMSDMRVAPEIKEMMKEIEKKKKIIKVVSLNNVYIPNSLEHLDKWCPGNKNRNCYRCDISEQTVEKIMLIDDIEDIWKILLLMGIGVFTTYKSIAYIEVMKELWSPDVSEYRGETVDLRPCHFNPKPTQNPHPPIYFGGESDAALDRVATLGDGWYAYDISPEELALRLDSLDSKM